MKANALADVGLISLTLLPRRDTLPVPETTMLQFLLGPAFLAACGELGGPSEESLPLSC